MSARTAVRETKRGTPKAAGAASIRVRRATRRDAATVTALRLALLREEAQHPLFADPHPEAATRARALSAAQLSGAGEAIFLAWEGARATGLLRCVLTRTSPLVREPRVAMLTTAYVIAERRRRGVLRLLVRAAEVWCRAHGVREVRLRCGVHNSGGQAAWRALGYEPAEIVLHRSLEPR